MRIVHAVITDAFAGTERYVAEVASAQAQRGHEVIVIGGAPLRERLSPDVAWRNGRTVAAGLRSVAGVGRADIAHGHLTYGEFVLAAVPRHRGRLVSTRHLATPRGQSAAGRVLKRPIERRLAHEIAISRFVSDAVSCGRLPVLHNGVAAQPSARPGLATTVLVAQRLEPEKCTEVALEAWFASGLPGRGWRLVVAGEGSRREGLQKRCAAHPLGTTVSFPGRLTDMDEAYGQAAVVLASAEAEPLGLTVLEAMARGIPVVAAAGGGHLETLAGAPELLFPPGDAKAAAAVLDSLAEPEARQEIGVVLQTLQREHFDLAAHVVELERTYERLLR